MTRRVSSDSLRSSEQERLDLFRRFQMGNSVICLPHLQLPPALQTASAARFSCAFSAANGFRPGSQLRGAASSRADRRRLQSEGDAAENE